MEDKKIKVLYVDDEPINLRLFEATFRREFIIFIADSAMEGLEILKNKSIDVVITDQRMPEITGLELLKKVQKLFPSIPPSRLMLSGFSESKDIEDAYEKYNLYTFISKPWTKNKIRQLIYESVKAENYDKREI